MMRAVLTVFLFFISISCVFAEIDPLYNLDTPPDVSFDFTAPVREYRIKKGNSSEISIPAPPQVAQKTSVQKEEGGIKGFFNKLFKRNQKQKAQFDTVGGGYRGNLPNVQSEFGYKTPKSSNVDDNKKKAEELLPEEFQKSKIDDPLFLDVILNKQNPSQYIADMLRVMKFLEGFRVVIQNHEDVQKFNANVNILDLHARRIEKLYKDKPEGMSPSYWLLIDLAYKAKVLGNLKFDANYYSKFSPIAGTRYDPANILSEDEKLLIELDKTVFAIRQLNN